MGRSGGVDASCKGRRMSNLIRARAHLKAGRLLLAILMQVTRILGPSACRQSALRYGNMAFDDAQALTVLDDEWS